MAILPVGIGSAEEGGYQIERSLRFDSSASAYLNRTFGAGNQKTWTLSVWVKRSALGDNQIFSNYTNGSDVAWIYFNSSNELYFQNYEGSNQLELKTTQVFRDVGAWGHLVIALDTTQATSSNRAKLYWNGVQITTLTTATYPSQNADLKINTNGEAHELGKGSSTYFNGYLTEVNFIDGSALDPTSFGEFNSDTGVWQPKAYSGSYGTNGFYLNFSDNASTTTLGDDLSGNGNDWSTSGFSVTAGADNDSLVDTPTPYGTDTGVGGEVRGNYCTLNPLSTTAGTYTQGNLRYVGASSWRRSNATLAVSTGKWYWEVTLGNAPFSPRGTTSSYNAFGFGLSTVFNSTTQSSSATDAVYLADNGYYKNFSGSWTDGGTAFSSGDTLAVAVDLDANTFTFYRNNTQITTGTIGGTSGRELVPIILSYDGSYGVMDCNFGQRPFAYTAPSGFQALVTTNILAGTVTTSGSFTGNLATDGPFVYLNGVPTAMTINGNAVTFGTHADKLANGFKVRSSSSSYNASGSNTYSVSTTGEVFKNEVAQSNP